MPYEKNVFRNLNPALQQAIDKQNLSTQKDEDIQFEQGTILSFPATIAWQRLHDLQRRALGFEDGFYLDYISQYPPLIAAQKYANSQISFYAQWLVLPQAAQTSIAKNIFDFIISSKNANGLFPIFLSAWHHLEGVNDPTHMKGRSIIINEISTEVIENAQRFPGIIINSFEAIVEVIPHEKYTEIAERPDEFKTEFIFGQVEAPPTEGFVTIPPVGFVPIVPVGFITNSGGTPNEGNFQINDQGKKEIAGDIARDMGAIIGASAANFGDDKIEGLTAAWSFGEGLAYGASKAGGLVMGEAIPSSGVGFIIGSSDPQGNILPGKEKDSKYQGSKEAAQEYVETPENDPEYKKPDSKDVNEGKQTSKDTTPNPDGDGDETPNPDGDGSETPNPDGDGSETPNPDGDGRDGNSGPSKYGGGYLNSSTFVIGANTGGLISQVKSGAYSIQCRPGLLPNGAVADYGFTAVAPLFVQAVINPNPQLHLEALQNLANINQGAFAKAALLHLGKF